MSEAENPQRKKTMISVRVWEDEYLAFKAKCHEERTTPTAIINRLIREYTKRDIF